MPDVKKTQPRPAQYRGLPLLIGFLPIVPTALLLFGIQRTGGEAIMTRDFYATVILGAGVASVFLLVIGLSLRRRVREDEARLQESEERLQTERHEAEETLRQVLQGARCVVWQAMVEERESAAPHGLHWEMQLLNEEAAQQVLPLETTPEKSYLQASVESRLDGERMNRVGAQALRSGAPGYAQEYRCRDRFGKVRWLREDTRIKAVAPGRWRVTGVCTEITERRAAEEELRTSQARLVEAQCVAQMGSWEVNLATGAVFWSEEMFRLMGLEPADNAPDLEELAHRFYHPDDREIVQEAGRDMTERGIPRDYDLRILRADDAMRWVHCVAKPLRDETGNITRLFGTVLDITERKRNEEHLQAITEELRRSNAALDKFAAVASHDLREPLRKIQTFGEMLQREAAESLSAECQGYVDRMTRAAARMDALIAGLLTYSRVSAKPPALAMVDLNAVVAEVMSDLEARVAEVQGRVVLAPLPTIYADPLQMRQLFQNLLSNALKFHQEGVPPVVHIQSVREAGPTDPQLRITFSDNGIGFPSEDAERIFGIFERAQSRSKYDGTGVGLAVCRKIVEQHGGTIQAEGIPDKGATFTFTLPLQAAPSASEQGAALPTVPAKSAA